MRTSLQRLTGRCRSSAISSQTISVSSQSCTSSRHISTAHFLPTTQNFLAQIEPRTELEDAPLVSHDSIPKRTPQPRRRPRGHHHALIANIRTSNSTPIWDWRPESFRTRPTTDLARERRTKRQRTHVLRKHASDDSVEDALARFGSWKETFDSISQSTLHPAALSPAPEDGSWLYELPNVEIMQAAWAQCDESWRADNWPTIMLSTLRFRPEKTVAVLESTMDPWPPGYAIEDVLDFISKHVDFDAYSQSRTQAAAADGLLSLLTKVLKDLPWGHVKFIQSTYGKLAARLSAPNATVLYDMLSESGKKLHIHSALHFASSMAKSSAYKANALQIIKDMAKSGVELNAPLFSSVITTLVSTADDARNENVPAIEGPASQNDAKFAVRQVMEELVESGFLPNAATLTAFLATLCKQENCQEALRLAKQFSEVGVKLDVPGIRILTAAAKRSLDESVVQEALAMSETVDPGISTLNNALHAGFYFATMECQDLPPPVSCPMFPSLLALYAQKFELGPLQWMIPVSLPIALVQQQEARESPSTALWYQQSDWRFEKTIIPVISQFFSKGQQPGKLLQPDSTTLSIMLRAYIKSLSSPQDLAAYYSFLKTRLHDTSQSENPTALLLREQQSLVHDCLILAMSERPELFRLSMQVFGDMLQSHLKMHKDKQNDMFDEDAPRHPSPTVFTYTILFKRLTRYKHFALLQELRQVMKEQGIAPTYVTWNELVKGFAQMQSIPQTIAVLRDMRLDGIKPTEATFKAFDMLRDQAGALEAMQSMLEKHNLLLSAADENSQDWF